MKPTPWWLLGPVVAGVACSSEVVPRGSGGGGQGGDAVTSSSEASTSVTTASSSSSGAGGAGGAAACVALAEPDVVTLPGAFERLSRAPDAGRLLVANDTEVRAYDGVSLGAEHYLAASVGLAWLGGDKAVAAEGTNLRSRLLGDIGNDQKNAVTTVLDVATFPETAIEDDVYFRTTDRIHHTTWPAEPSTDAADFFAVPSGAGNRLVAVSDGDTRYLAWDVGTEVEVWTMSTTPALLGSTDLGLAPEEFVVHAPTGLVFGRQGQAFGAGVLNGQTLAPYPGAFARAVALDGDHLALAYSVATTHYVSVCCVDESFPASLAGLQLPDACATVEVPDLPFAMAFRTPGEVAVLLDASTQTDLASIAVEVP